MKFSFFCYCHLQSILRTPKPKMHSNMITLAMGSYELDEQSWIQLIGCISNSIHAAMYIKIVDWIEPLGDNGEGYSSIQWNHCTRLVVTHRGRGESMVFEGTKHDSQYKGTYCFGFYSYMHYVLIPHPLCAPPSPQTHLFYCSHS